MNLPNGMNMITIAILFIFLMPVTTGILNPVSKESIRQSLHSIVRGTNFMVSIVAAVSLVRLVLPVSEYRNDIVACLIAMFLSMSVIFFVLELLRIPFFRYLIVPLTDKLSSALDLMNSGTRRLIGGLWQLPKSICMVLVFSLLLYFYANFINNPSAGDYINASKTYQAIHKNVLQPVLSTGLVRKVPVLVSDAFRKAAEDYTPANSGSSGEPNYWKLPAIKYFNGMTIDEAVKSNSEIDDTAKQIVGIEKDEMKKAYLLYKWVSKNIKYDFAKAEIVLENPSRVNSGSIITFEERTGVCFDYSCLYVSMCRAVGINVRLVSGLGNSGPGWGGHVWNQVYDPEEKRWINVDPTYGNSGYDYFDNPDFSLNHKYDVIQAEWQPE
ncbi:MAG: transglutaminase-like domain-containing protein [Eubacteriales bacterium]|nr:transglutaminase-like domain-containing protein [Eubacteriales bacterium]